MNTATTATPKTPAPFAAVLHFRANCLYQKKHASWTFKSNDLCPEPTPVHKQFDYIKNFVFREMWGQFMTASIFDNCGRMFVPYGHEVPKSKNLVLQVNYNRVTIDNTKYLDLSWLEHTYCPRYLDELAKSFSAMHQEILVNPLAAAIQQYKHTFNLPSHE